MTESEGYVHEPSTLSRRLQQISAACAPLYLLLVLPFLSRYGGVTQADFVSTIIVPGYLAFLPYGYGFDYARQLYMSGKRKALTLGENLTILFHGACSSAMYLLIAGVATMLLNLGFELCCVYIFDAPTALEWKNHVWFNQAPIP